MQKSHIELMQKLHACCHLYQMYQYGNGMNGMNLVAVFPSIFSPGFPPWYRSMASCSPAPQIVVFAFGHANLHVYFAQFLLGTLHLLGS